MENKKYEPYVKLNDVTYSYSKVEGMEINSISDLICKINLQISYLTTQEGFEMKKGKKKDFKKLNSIRDSKRHLQDAVYWCSNIRKDKRATYNDNINSRFREAAADILDKATFDKVVLRAQALSEMDKEIRI